MFSACMIFLLFSVIGYFLQPNYKFIIAFGVILIALIFAILFICKKVKPYTFLCMILSTVMISSSLISSYFFFDVNSNKVAKYYDQEVVIEALVIGERYRGEGYTGYDIIVTKVDGEENKHNALLVCTYDSVLEPGFKFTATVEGSDFNSFLGGYDQRPAMNSDKIFIQYTSSDESKSNILDENVFHPRVFFSSINDSLSRIFSRYLDKDTANMSSALLLGNKDRLSNTVIRDFTRAGASHILALSGMHMSIIMGIFLFIFKKLRINPKIIAVVLSFIALSYLFITGLQISAARSVIMLLCVYLSVLSQRTPDSLTSLGLAGMLLMLIFPGSVVDAGYWMSFSATLGILVYTTPFTKFINNLLQPYSINMYVKKGIISILSAIAVSLFATIPLITVLCIFIKRFSLFSVISSIILSVPASGMILFSLLFLLFSPIPIVSDIISTPLYHLTEFMTSYCEKVSNIEGVVVALNYPFATLAAIVIIATILYSFATKKRNLFITLIPYAVAIALFIGVTVAYNAMESDKVRVDYVNTSSTSDMLVLSKGGNAIICDIGNGSKSSYNSATGYASLARATEIKAVILTKYSRSHSASLYEVFTSQMVRELWLPYPENESEYHLMAPLITLAEKYGVPSYIYRRGDNLEAFEFTLISTDSFSIDRSSVPTIVVSIKTRNEKLTYCGSAFNECNEVEDINKYLKNSDFVIFGTVGPKVKTEFFLPENSDVHTVIFGDKLHSAYYNENHNHPDSYLAEKTCNIYLTE